MKIIKQGVPKVKVVEITCKGCDSILEYDAKDIKRETDPRDNSTDYWIDCPVCKKQITVKQL